MKYMVFFSIFLVHLMVSFHCILLDVSQNALQTLALSDEGTKNKTLNIETLLRQHKEKEMESEKTQKVNRNFERMIQLVNILGQVDSFLSERTKTLLRKLALLAEDDNGYYGRRRS